MNKILMFYDFCKKKCKDDKECKDNCNKILQQFFKEIKKNKTNKIDNVNIYYL